MRNCVRGTHAEAVERLHTCTNVQCRFTRSFPEPHNFSPTPAISNLNISLKRVWNCPYFYIGLKHALLFANTWEPIKAMSQIDVNCAFSNHSSRLFCKRPCVLENVITTEMKTCAKNTFDLSFIWYDNFGNNLKNKGLGDAAQKAFSRKL